MSVRRGKRIEPRSRDWMTGEGFTNGLSTPDLSYLDSVVMNALSGGYAAGVKAARDAVADVAYVRPAYYGKGVLIRGCEPDMVRQDALAAIDALRGDA